MKHNINLTEVETSYAHYIKESYNNLTNLYNDNTVDANTFKTKILETVVPANDTKSKRNFILNINKKFTKNDLLFYISNVMMSAQHLASDPDAKWSNEN